MLDKIFENTPLAMSVLISLVGLAITILALYYMIKANESKKWDQTEGKILTSEVVRVSSNTSRDDFSPTYKAEICYVYKVNNERFIADKINVFFNFSSSFSIRAHRLVDRYPKDSAVTVYFDPNKPQDCVLEPGIKSDMIVFMMIGLLITAIALTFATSQGLLKLLIS